jgi:hypothetical protein
MFLQAISGLISKDCGPDSYDLWTNQAETGKLDQGKKKQDQNQK